VTFWINTLSLILFTCGCGRKRRLIGSGRGRVNLRQ
jgi:hypothetical protein